MTPITKPGLEPLIDSLMRVEAYDHATRELRLLETHISWVILTGDFAYKIKKPVNFGFVDFSTLERRQFFCHEELRLNSRFSSDLYLSVKPIFGTRDRATFRGSGEPIEYAVQMRQFDQMDLLPNVLLRGEMTAAHFDHLAIKFAAFQATAPVAQSPEPFGSAALIREEAKANFTHLGQHQSQTPTVQNLEDWTNHEFSNRESDFIQRQHEGKIRDGHGDLHLGNLILRHGEVEAFDCIEFNPELRWIDVISEVAFLVMDLAHRNQNHFGWQFLNSWLAETGDYAGLKVWSWYFCYRAMVRAKVTALRLQQSDVTSGERSHLKQELKQYLDLATCVTGRPAPILLLTHGVSGCGKSHWAKRLAADLGFVWIRSDVERKRLFGDTLAGADLYSADATLRTYDRLEMLARIVLQSRWPVIVDATFLKRSQRASFHRLANDIGIKSCVLMFRADAATARQRIANRKARGDDVSDATEAVLESQLQTVEALDPSEEGEIIACDTDQPTAQDQLFAAVRTLLSAQS